MNKKIGLIVGAVMVFGGLYAANTYMVHKVANKIPEETQTRIASYNASVVGDIEVEQLSSKVKGGHVDEAYRIFLGGKNSGIQPLYLNHSADVGLFGTRVTGSIQLPKDKGFAKYFTQEVGVFTESIKYKLNAVSQTINVDAQIKTDAINKEGAIISPVALHLAFNGNDHKYKSLASIEHFSAQMPDNRIDVKNIVSTTEKNETLVKGSATVDSVQISQKIGSDLTLHNFVINSMFNADATEPVLSIDAKVAKTNINNMFMHVKDVVLSFSGQLNHFDLVSLQKLQQVNQSTPEEQVAQLLTQFLGYGAHLDDVNIAIDKTNLTAKAQLIPADYTNKTARVVGIQLKQNLNIDANLNISKLMLKKFGISEAMVASVLAPLQFNEDNKAFTGKVTTKDGTLIVNGKPVSKL